MNRDDSRWWRRTVLTGQAVPSVDIIGEGPVRKLTSFNAAESGSQGFDQGKRLVLQWVQCSGLAAGVDCELRFESVEDPNATAVVRDILSVYCIAASPVNFFMWIGDGGIALPGREGVPAADRTAKLRVSAFTKAGIPQNFSAAFATGSSSGMRISSGGVWIPITANAPFDGYRGDGTG